MMLKVRFSIFIGIQNEVEITGIPPYPTHRNLHLQNICEEPHKAQRQEHT